MKYFKYRNINKVQQNADKLFLASLGKDKEKKIKKSRRTQKFLSNLGISLFVILYGLFIYLLTLIPKPDTTFLAVIYGIGCALLGIIGLIVCAIIICIPITKLMNRVEYDLPKIQRKFISKACENVREFYGVNEEYLLTKCFNSSDSKFINHDICIFKYNNEIRITTDIINGFINGESDLGCYSIEITELKIYKSDFNNKRTTVLEFADQKFTVGIKAYSFIVKLIGK